MIDMFDYFDILFPVLITLAFGVFGLAVARGIVTWNKNNHCSRITAPAVIVAKRTNVIRHNHVNAGDTTGARGFHTDTHTTYYVTFQFESGDRMEFQVYGSEYGMLAEGGEGKLTFRGTRYLSFER